MLTPPSSPLNQSFYLPSPDGSFENETQTIVPSSSNFDFYFDYQPADPIPVEEKIRERDPFEFEDLNDRPKKKQKTVHPRNERKRDRSDSISSRDSLFPASKKFRGNNITSSGNFQISMNRLNLIQIILSSISFQNNEDALRQFQTTLQVSKVWKRATQEVISQLFIQNKVWCCERGIQSNEHIRIFGLFCKYKLTYLNLSLVADLDDKTLIAITKKCTNIQFLRLSNAQITDSGLRNSSLSNLKVLELDGCSNVQQIALNAMRKLRTLRVNNLPNLKLISFFENENRLENLEFSNCANLKNIPPLRDFDLKKLSIIDCPNFKSRIELFINNLPEMNFSGTPISQIIFVHERTEQRTFPLREIKIQ